jgi:hypothetical protein
MLYATHSSNRTEAAPDCGPTERPSESRRQARYSVGLPPAIADKVERKAQEPDVPDGDWYKDFGTFQLCGSGRYPSTFLLAGHAARGKRL